MAIKTAYVSKLGKGYKISEHFTLGEFQCKDGSDKVLYSTGLLALLETLRAYLGGDAEEVKIILNSAYRTASHNRKVGGSSLSQHLSGTAVDMKVKRRGQYLNAELLCCLCQSLGFKGIGYISSNSLHVDDRPTGTYRGDERKGYRGNVNNDFYSYFGIKKSQIDALKVVAKDNNVPTKKEEENEPMTQEQFNKMMDAYLADRSDDAPASWSEEDRKWAEKLGIVKGNGDGEMGYKEFITKEQFVAMLGRFANELAKILKA